jgi:hypothetical protein
MPKPVMWKNEGEKCTEIFHPSSFYPLQVNPSESSLKGLLLIVGPQVWTRAEAHDCFP